MTWSDFTWTLAVVYAVYYGLNIVYDLLSSPGGTNRDEIVPLTFDDDTEAKDVDGMEEMGPARLREPMAHDGLWPDIERTTEQGLGPEAGGEAGAIRPAGNAWPMADSIVSGGLEYGDLLKQAVKGAISRSAQIDFG